MAPRGVAAARRELPVGVVGGGLGGLAAACTLAARGHRVVLFEANPWLGGKAAALEVDGFRFDMGPTILTLPSVLGRLFAEAGERLEGALDLVRLDPQWRAFYEGGATLDLVADVAAMAGRLDAFAPGTGAGDGYRRLLALSARQHAASRSFYFWRSVDGVRDTLDRGTLLRRAAPGELAALRPGATVGGTIRRHVRDGRAAQLLEHFTQYVGSAPDASPAVLCGVAHMQVDEGVWYPRGGTRAVPVALAALAERLGVEVRAGTAVRRLLVEGGAVAGVETATGERVPLSAVVSNADAARTYRELLAGEPAGAAGRRRVRRHEAACSGVVLYLGLRRRYEHLLHHNFVFSRDPHAEFEAIYRRGEPAPDPTAYVCAPAATDPAVAPPGGEALYVLVHTPWLRPHHDWGRLLPGYRRTIIDKLRRVAGLDDLEERIVVERTLTPQDIHDRYRVLDGAIYGLASHGRWLGAFKPGNRRRDLPGLYLAGGAAHPGPGMPMVLMSGWIAADALDRDGVAAPTGRLRAGAAAAADRPLALAGAPA